MTDAVYNALWTFHTRMGFAMLALDELMRAVDAERGEPAPPKRHPLCEASMCGRVDCGRPGPCYVQQKGAE